MSKESNEDRMLNIWDMIPENIPIWPYGDELANGHFTHTTWEWWRETLSHPRYSDTHRCCKTCGCATSCLLSTFCDAVTATAIRELLKAGVFKETAGCADSSNVVG